MERVGTDVTVRKPFQCALCSASEVTQRFVSLKRHTVRVRHIMLVNLTITLFSVTLAKNRTIKQKIMLVSDHYARVILVDISPMNPRYHPNESCCDCCQDDCQT